MCPASELRLEKAANCAASIVLLFCTHTFISGVSVNLAELPAVFGFPWCTAVRGVDLKVCIPLSPGHSQCRRPFASEMGEVVL